MLRGVVLVVLLVASAAQSWQLKDGDLNSVIDQVILAEMTQFTAAGYDQMPLPELNTTFSTNVGPFKIEGRTILGGGVFTNLTSLERKSDASIYTEGNETLFSVSLGLKEAKVSHSDFKFSYWVISTGGEISANCTKNEITLKFKLVRDGANCTSNIEKFEITDLSGFYVNSDSDSFIDRMRNKVFAVILNDSATEITSFVNMFFDYIKSKLNDIDFCAKFSK